LSLAICLNQSIGGYALAKESINERQSRISPPSDLRHVTFFAELSLEMK